MISVIIPTLNEEQVIGKLLSQFSEELVKKYDIELILSDGRSEDRTVEIARERVQAIVSHSGNGRQTIAEARNLGARRSSGEVLFFFNADVRIEDPSGYFKEMLEALESSGTVAATCPVRVYPEEENSVDSIYHLLHNFYVWVLNAIGFGTGRGECQVVKRREFFHAGGYDEKLAAGEDFDLYRKLARLGRIKYVRSISVFESPRRYRKLGYLRVTFYWLLNALSIIFLRKSFSEEWEQVR